MRVPALLLAATALLAAACAPADQAQPTPSGPAVAGAGDCAKDRLRTREPGRITFATDQPAYAPWFEGDDPTNGRGFEAAVAYAVAEKLGYQRGEVGWTRVPFGAAIQPGPKQFDADLNQFSVTEERQRAVDFSSPYYDVRQAVIAPKDSPVASARSVSDLARLRLGAQVGTTSYQAIKDQIRPNAQPSVYNTNEEAKLALGNGQIQALVVDLPTALFITSSELRDTVIVGQLPPSGDRPERFGMVLDKGSPLTRCVSSAVDALRADGTLSTLERQWLADAAKAPELT
ncbi:amino acid ABC transporter substrate-binding protein, PAAT family (TC 3.A.1.3.-) [Streptoalloteichus tenebrarius]|uniref:Amino acid ABC transporter substrate-binding protein, PAAT family (TC 3.A.1.3.-) n=1 Tax=Streptoalloteichus tenebrarius (strain ATCC 17920 / DSM 40477 / JCM 4838 / CBS 697.72 / NBRC 16177 / NCIMB 11028 / NRRL B-12390 / A12253. 1 / ISP 5477) TaxID=1933 RepID=A0ABT1I2M3_STRSD|nr:transporter substrate-binding domain-containing protein [Streptoalloteichus tenebrarius]MCP2262014.1 amino acid ABC transporter substrate-binding protein, PAAT family (TC 3.A.1.3.-) [Streptoalloteichus tenebrarius]BFF02136.1 ABC transporter substrate-binding protein [Streptoalloteichus tenebrarius]